MTTSQPPVPPPSGPGPGGQPPPPPGYGSPPGYGPPPGQPAPASSGISMDRGKLRMADYVIAGGTLLFFVLAFLPWLDYGDEFFFATVSGWQMGQVSTAFVLFALATAWTLLPAFADVEVGFPRAWITVGLAGLGFLLTLLSWIRSFDAGFSIWALLGLITGAAILAFAVFALLPELRNRPALPGALTGAAQWANQPGPDASAGPASSAPAPWSTPPPPPPPAPPTEPGSHGDRPPAP